jgi:hypothetical protein
VPNPILSHGLTLASCCLLLLQLPAAGPWPCLSLFITLSIQLLLFINITNPILKEEQIIITAATLLKLYIPGGVCLHW